MPQPAPHGENPAESAAERFRQGFSCAQAVLAACAEACGLSQEEAVRLGAGLGAGLGGLRETCGAITAMAMVLGRRLAPETQPMESSAKAALYREIQSAVRDFDAAFGTHNCRELLRRAAIEKRPGEAPEARSERYYRERPCAAFVRFCAERALR